VLDADPQSRDRILMAAALAERFGAHLVGLYVKVSREPPGRFEYFNSDAPLLGPLYRDIEENARAEAEQARVLFEDIVGRQSLSAEWREASGYPGEVAAVHGRYADLIIVGQLDPNDAQAPLIKPRPEEVALLAGRPVLVLPYVGKFEQIGRRVLVAWDASREATRAVNDAMPLLAGASSVTVIAIDPEQSRERHGEVPGAHIALHLARHGVSAKVERTVSAGIGIGNTLHETLEYDAGGQILSGTLMDYALPYASDVPPVESFYQEVPATTNPLGLRGLGECGNPGLGGAIANAICDALGPQQAGITVLPLTPALVWGQVLKPGAAISP
jgi:nucleotide-binding universal stress UspA family protein